MLDTSLVLHTPTQLSLHKKTGSLSQLVEFEASTVQNTSLGLEFSLEPIDAVATELGRVVLKKWKQARKRAQCNTGMRYPGCELHYGMEMGKRSL